MNIILHIFFCYCIINILKAQIIPICSPVKSNIDDASQLPKFPREFQTRVSISYMDRKSSSDVVLLYDSLRNRAEMIVMENGNIFKRVFFYDTNELFLIRNQETCSVSKLNESMDNFLFGLINSTNGFSMNQPNEMFHFNNKFPLEKKTQTIVRGIPVNHFTSCQNWTFNSLETNFKIDFYFKVPDYPQVLNLQDNQGIVEIEVDGFLYDDNNSIPFKNKYSFFEFRSIIENREDLDRQPPGLFCKHQTFKKKVPQIPSAFSYYEESISSEYNLAFTSRLYYAKNINAFRVDLPSSSATVNFFEKDPVKFIHDYNSGIGYVINKITKSCSFYPLGTQTIDINELKFVDSNFGTLIELRDPQEIFRLDDSSFYAGKRYERGILCDVYVSNRTDLKFDGIDAKYYVHELFVLSDESKRKLRLDEIETHIPISFHISAPGKQFSIINHIYNFDSSFERNNFDISDCFTGKDKRKFGIKFGYPDGIDKITFDTVYGSRLIEIFDEMLVKTFFLFNASPLRIVKPLIESYNDGFTVYSGITNFAPATYHFKKTGESKILINKAKYALETNSLENCAFVCLNDSVFDAFNYKCMSFDYCTSDKKMYCSFYNESLITDPSIVDETASQCDHYAKPVKKFDAVDIETLYRSVKEAVSKQLFNLEIIDENSEALFPSKEIFDADTVNFDANADWTGSTSFFQQFNIYKKQYDLNIPSLKNDTSILLREKNGISVDECSRLCLDELSFNCQLMVYTSSYKNCKWSSLDANDLVIENSNFFEQQDGYDLFLKNTLFNYIEYKFKVTSNVDYKVIPGVESASQCANKCNKQSDCRSFNLCKESGNSFKCLLSASNIHSNLNLTEAPSCSHYSKQAIYEFQLVAQKQLGVEPQIKLVDLSIESCAEKCILEDSFLCRSFDYMIDINVCYLYKENLKDQINTDLQIIENLQSNHYSRLYYEKDGLIIKIEANSPDDNTIRYKGGTIFGIVFSLIIGNFIFGILIAFVYLKLTKKEDILPVMRFINPNFEK